MRIAYLTGDATRPQRDGKKIICHVCNDIGAWGAGFVLAVSRRWPEPEESYREMENRILGEVMFVDVEPDILVANMIGQRGVHCDKDGQPPIRYTAIRQALATVNEMAKLIGATIHMPRIGCGLAGGRWEDIEKIIYEVCTVNVYVYDLK